MIANRSVPSSSVIPVLAYSDVAEAADWLCNAFGFRERLRIGTHRAQLVFGDGAVIVTNLGASRDQTGPLCDVGMASAVGRATRLATRPDQSSSGGRSCHARRTFITATCSGTCSRYCSAFAAQLSVSWPAG